MRRVLLALIILSTPLVSEKAAADDGCQMGPYGIQCYPGARPGVPYYGPYSDRPRYYGGYGYRDDDYYRPHYNDGYRRSHRPQYYYWR